MLFSRLSNKRGGKLCVDISFLVVLILQKRGEISTSELYILVSDALGEGNNLETDHYLPFWERGKTARKKVH